MPEPTLEEKIKALETSCNTGRWKIQYNNDEPNCVDCDGTLCPVSTLSSANIPGSDAYNCKFRGKVNKAFIDEAYQRLMKPVSKK